MRNLIVVLAISFLALYFGYPKYQDYRFTEQVRENMRTETVNIKALEGLPIKAEVDNNYPQIEMRFKFKDVAYDDLNAAIKKTMRQEVKSLACRNLKNIEGQNHQLIKAKTKILEEDKVSIRIIVRGQAGKHITEHTQVLSKCANFAALKQLV